MRTAASQSTDSKVASCQLAQPGGDCVSFIGAYAFCLAFFFFFTQMGSGVNLDTSYIM